MDKVLRDLIQPKQKVDGVYPWDFKAPAYDHRTSCSIPGGNDYGVGFKTPTGLFKPRSIKEGPIPQEAKCFSPDESLKKDMKG